MRKHIICTVVALSAVMSAATGALAQSQQDQQACTHDAFQFCGDVIPDRDRVFSCLVAKQTVISAACRTVMAPYLHAPAVQKAAVRAKGVKSARGVKTGKSAKSVQTRKSTSSKSTKLATTSKISTSTSSSSSSKRVKSAKTAKTARSKGPLDLRPR